MASKQQPGDGPRTSAQFANTVKESAQQIWLAGLGAFSKAQEEGGKVFEALVKEGVTMQKKTQSAAEEKFTEAGSRMASMAEELSSKASGQWDRLENIFEERVGRALKALGVPTSADTQALLARIEQLERQVRQLGGSAVASKRRAVKPTAKALKSAARKRAPVRKSAD
jgi:poly(hydroxyalkanoate) granule-associated protein